MRRAAFVSGQVYLSVREVAMPHLREKRLWFRGCVRGHFQPTGSREPKPSWVLSGPNLSRPKSSAPDESRPGALTPTTTTYAASQIIIRRRGKTQRKCSGLLRFPPR